jgi:uncharacterized protein DUF2721
MPGSEAAAAALGSVVHIIQIALTPVFLLSGIATLLNVFSTRLARVADRVEQLIKTAADGDAVSTARIKTRLAALHRRSLALNMAVLLGAGGGAATCATVLALFIEEAGALPVATLLYITFGLAIACTLGSIGAYAVEMTIAGRHVRAEAAAGWHLADPE